MDRPVRIGFVTNGNYFAHNIIGPTLRKHRDQVGGVVITTASGSLKRSRKENLKRIFKKAGWRYFSYKTISYLWFSAVAKLMRGRRVFFVDEACDALEIPKKVLLNVNSKESVQFLKDADLDLLVVVSVPYMVRQRVADTASTLAVNVHSSKLPAYAGVQTYVWVLANGETETGMTIHELTQIFDEGAVLEQASLNIEKNESVFHLFDRQTQAGGRLLLDLIDRLNQDAVQKLDQDLSQRSYFSAPGKEQIDQLRARGHRLVRLRELIAAATRRDLLLNR